jgi:hypothetical protein
LEQRLYFGKSQRSQVLLSTEIVLPQKGLPQKDLLPLNLLFLPGDAPWVLVKRVLVPLRLAMSPSLHCLEAGVLAAGTG